MLSASDIEEIKLRFDTQGFIHLKNIIPPSFLKRLQLAFEKSMQDTNAGRKDHSTSRRLPVFFDMPRILDADDAFIDLADLNTIFPVLVALLGDDIQLTETAARLFYPGATFTAPFHSDLAHVSGFSHAHSLNFFSKVHFYLEDLEENQGCLAFVPGSHRLPAGYARPPALINEHSDAVVKIVPKAGDVVIFNAHVMHMALDNTSGKVRKSIIYSYSHFWMKQAPSAIPANRDRFVCRQRRQLFGVDEPGIAFFNRTLAIPHATTYRRLVSSTKGMLKRFMGRD